jgi:drug/metabolite transporter (DMT)-like permease
LQAEVKNYGVLGLVVVLQVVGNVFLSRGMRSVGGINRISPSSLYAYGIKTATNPWVMLGFFLLLAFFALYLAALSRLDLSYVLPMTASTYVLTAFSAWLILGESVSPTRWAGTLAVTIGIVLVTDSERRKSRQVRVSNEVLEMAAISTGEENTN